LTIRISATIIPSRVLFEQYYLRVEPASCFPGRIGSFKEPRMKGGIEKEVKTGCGDFATLEFA